MIPKDITDSPNKKRKPDDTDGPSTSKSRSSLRKEAKSPIDKTNDSPPKPFISPSIASLIQSLPLNRFSFCPKYIHRDTTPYFIDWIPIPRDMEKESTSAFKKDLSELIKPFPSSSPPSSSSSTTTTSNTTTTTTSKKQNTFSVPPFPTVDSDQDTLDLNSSPPSSPPPPPSVPSPHSSEEEEEDVPPVRKKVAVNSISSFSNRNVSSTTSSTTTSTSSKNESKYFKQNDTKNERKDPDNKYHGSDNKSPSAKPQPPKPMTNEKIQTFINGKQFDPTASKSKSSPEGTFKINMIYCIMT